MPAVFRIKTSLVVARTHYIVFNYLQLQRKEYK